MRCVGLIGGISWYATVRYYSYINKAINEHFGNNTNPPLLVYNVNQSQMHHYQKINDWEAIAEMIYEGGQTLAKAGAELILICSNTTHKVFPNVQRKVNSPLLHIADATANKIKSKKLSKVGFIGTKFGMEDQFLVDKFQSYGIDIIRPENAEIISELHRIIHEELTYDRILEKSKNFVLKVIEEMRANGSQGIILGCTEFSLLFQEIELDLPVFDTIPLHAQLAVDFILSETQEFG